MVARIQCPVSFRARLVHLGHRDRNGQVVIERCGEAWGPLARNDGTDPTANTVQEFLDPDIGFDRVLQAVSENSSIDR